MPKPAYEFFDPEQRLAWTPIPQVAGLSEKILARDEESGDYTRLLRFASGTDTSPMGVQRHDFWEEVWIVSGAIHDLSLDENFSAGMYACRPPGMAHGPWRAPDGCVTFEQRYHK
jgi:ChrR Cupin-like domain